MYKEFLDKHFGDLAVFLSVYSWVVVFMVEWSRF
mgnify:CR=1 FL=1